VDNGSGAGGAATDRTRRRALLLLRDLVVVGLVALTTSLMLGIVHGDGRPVPVAPDLSVPLRPLGPVSVARAQLAGLRVVARRPHVPGYDRSCSGSDACVFGPAWSDDVEVTDGHNGIDTRTDVITRDRAGAAVLRDPYSGQPAPLIQIDHLVPLAAAWDLGASRWPPHLRADFANDPEELLAVSAAANQAKSDEIPGDWAGCLRAPGPCTHATPAVWFPRPEIRCALGERYIRICHDYGLPITVADHRSLADMLATCTS
jgi:hypothetical protein